MMASEITLVEAWNKCWDTCAPIKWYWNDELIWDDTVDYNEWISPKDAFRIFVVGHPKYREYMVHSLNIEIVDYHHSVVHMYGE